MSDLEILFKLNVGRQEFTNRVVFEPLTRGR
jgi:hypothetical protein